MKVVHAELHNSIVFPGSDILGIVTLHGTKIQGIEMEWRSDGLLIRTPKLKSNKIVGFVPAANVKCLQFEDDNAKVVEMKSPRKFESKP